MCLAIPAKVVEAEDLGLTRVGKGDFGGVMRPINLDFVPEANIGDYVLVHVGFAISLIDEAEAKRTYEVLKQMGELEPDA